ncbi:transporter substrate-binding domain-containing protein, partial [Pseudodesulfovibrio sp.]|uniref:substrate-binding periplasmic protein n=1 Tax=Pseudodesulfovibrio sp. TaxID=2035812 RepID=UPI0026349323
MNGKTSSVALLAALMLLAAAALPGLAAETRELTLFLPDTDWPPYVPKGAEGAEGGVFGELLRAIVEPLGYTVKVRFLPERRGWEMLDSGLVDVHVKAREWVEDPDKYLWSEPFLLNKDVLLYSAARPLEYTSPEALYGLSVAAIRGFLYPVFEPHFGPGRITRVDVATPYAMLGLLERNRVAAALVNRSETEWMLRHTPSIDPSRFRLDRHDFDRAQYRFLFSPRSDWRPLIARI